jgi:hypothetical protein
MEAPAPADERGTYGRPLVYVIIAALALTLVWMVLGAIYRERPAPPLPPVAPADAPAPANPGAGAAAPSGEAGPAGE